MNMHLCYDEHVIFKYAEGRDIWKNAQSWIGRSRREVSIVKGLGTDRKGKPG